MKGPPPKVGDRVLVEASYNPNMPFKWNANRVQVIPGLISAPVQVQNNSRSGQNSRDSGGRSGSYNAVPPPNFSGGKFNCLMTAQQKDILKTINKIYQYKYFCVYNHIKVLYFIFLSFLRRYLFSK